MSLVANIIQVGGFAVMLLFMGFSTDQDVTSMLGFAVSFVLHSVLVIMQIYYDYILAKWFKNKSPETQQLITNVSGDEETMTTTQQTETMTTTQKDDDSSIEKQNLFQENYCVLSFSIEFFPFFFNFIFEKNENKLRNKREKEISIRREREE